MIGTFVRGSSISFDNGLIPQKLLKKSEFYYPLHVAVGVALSQPDLMPYKFLNNTVRGHGRENTQYTIDP